MSLKLKLNLNTNPLAGARASPSSTPVAATPGGSKPVIKLTNKSTPSTPIAPEPVLQTKTKAGRTSKPSQKLAANKKRHWEQDASDSEDELQSIVQPAKKVKLSVKTPSSTRPTPIPPIFKPKVKGKPPKRTPGEGYDTEASDHELDPMIEEEFILRMFPGEDCDYLRSSIIEKKIGLPMAQGGANIQMKYFSPEGRKACVTIRGNPYAACLVDLPCIIEGMKSWDKRGWWKSADICQMLWVFARVTSEDEAKTIPLPQEVDKDTYQYPHGITPPMHFARKRRFRKRISRTAIEAVEDAVEKLLAADAEAQSVRFEMIDPDAGRDSQVYSPGNSNPYGEEEGVYSDDQDEDAEGEIDEGGYFDGNHNGAENNDDDDADLAADLEAALEAEEFAVEAETPMSTAGTLPLANGEVSETPATIQAEDSGDESIEDDDGDDGDDDGDEELDEDEKARLAHLEAVREDIADMEKKLANTHAQMATTASHILRRRLEETARNLKAELQLKKSSIGEEDDS
ncbi:TAFII55 protein conserved region-domain-containing protein [Amylocarpus encephaloides]|uniref:TAFII55 protein conserved region-domain-containing protein n=1 Tax=Amylocarpus encephaloides TaxID=45428 RepID=A0A9P8C800_9HELO|nr:TAFII55 protein conserved region-domain-containing protein [Amylocarpus encephaloides]